MTKAVDFLTEEQVTRAMLLGVVICFDRTHENHEHPPWFVYRGDCFLCPGDKPNPDAYFYSPDDVFTAIVELGGDEKNWTHVRSANVSWGNYPPPGGVRKSGK